MHNFERERSCATQKSYFVRSFGTPTPPKLRFWKGSLFKTSNEIASATTKRAISFDILKSKPLQNLSFGRVCV